MKRIWALSDRLHSNNVNFERMQRCHVPFPSKRLHTHFSGPVSHSWGPAEVSLRVNKFFQALSVIVAAGVSTDYCTI